jgi:hypothetical protein
LPEPCRRAHESDQSVRLVIQLMKSPRNIQNYDDLIIARRKEKKISEQITTELAKHSLPAWTGRTLRLWLAGLIEFSILLFYTICHFQR